MLSGCHGRPLWQLHGSLWLGLGLYLGLWWWLLGQEAVLPLHQPLLGGPWLRRPRAGVLILGQHLLLLHGLLQL